MKPSDPFADQKICAKCKFYQLDRWPNHDGRVDYTIYLCTQPTPPELCYEYRQEGAACGPDGKLWTAAT